MERSKGVHNMRGRLDSSDLLEYNPTYRVLICRECRYAVQKSAIPSHLLRHKIYRGERQRLLSSVAKYDLLEPEQVDIPSPTCPPIDLLPVIAGYCCTAVAGCGKLCASPKRLQLHWRESHGISKQASDITSLARRVKLQTFFRGIKIKYFEVNPSRAAQSNDGFEDRNVDEPSEEDEDARIGSVHAESRLHELDQKQSPTQPVVTSQPPAINVDLNMLIYFHQFTTITLFTLPNPESSEKQTLGCWITTTIPEALHQTWLMCGLLAISAFHMATLTADITAKQLHYQRAVDLSAQFDAGLVKDTSSAETDVTKTAAKRIRCILLCARLTLVACDPDSSLEREQTDLNLFLRTMKDWAIPSTRSSNDNDNADVFHQAKTTLDTVDDASSAEAFVRLRLLSSRMAEALGRPDNPDDVITTLSAVAHLVLCYRNSFLYSPFGNNEESGAAWHSMVAWLSRELDGRFEAMIMQKKPAALVVLAHWAALLIGRIEDCGFWFMKGLCRKMITLTFEQIPAENKSVRDLVMDLMRL